MLDSLLPTSRPPAPVEGSAGEAGVLLDRILAAAIDVAICVVFVEIPFIYALSVVFPAEYDALGPAVVALSIAALLPIFSTYSFALEWLFARTPGKVHRGLLVVGPDGYPPSAIESAVRNLLLYVDLIGIPPLVVGTVVAAVAGGRRLGDLAAGTSVVRARAPPGEPIVDPAGPDRQVGP